MRISLPCVALPDQFGVIDASPFAFCIISKKLALGVPFGWLLRAIFELPAARGDMPKLVTVAVDASM